MKHYAVALSDKQILRGELSQIMDTVRDVSDTTSMAVIKGKVRNARKLQAEIKFENSLTNPDFDSEYEYNLNDVLYLNEVAKQILDSRGVSIKILKEVESVPSHTGIALSIPVYL